MHEAAIRSEPARARRTLSTGVLVFRLAALAWMIVLNVTAGQPFRRPASAWAGIAVAAAWTVWLAVSPDVRDGPAVLWVDLAWSSPRRATAARPSIAARAATC